MNEEELLNEIIDGIKYWRGTREGAKVFLRKILSERVALAKQEKTEITTLDNDHKKNSVLFIRDINLALHRAFSEGRKYSPGIGVGGMETPKPLADIFHWLHNESYEQSLQKLTSGGGKAE